MKKEFIIDRLKDYTNVFSKEEKTNFGERYRDDIIYDMYCHNFSLIENYQNDEQFIKIAKEEIERQKGSGKKYARIESYNRIPDEVFEKIGFNGDIEKNEVYDAKIDEIKIDCKEDLALIEINEENFEQFLRLNVENDNSRYEDHFSERRVEGKKEVYFGGKMRCFGALVGGKIVGSVEYFISNNTLQLENLFTLESFQHRGVASNLFKKLIEKAKYENVQNVFLVADEEDTPKEMYKKWGFKKNFEIRAYTVKFD